MQVRKRKY